MKTVRFYFLWFLFVAFISYWAWIFISRGVKNHFLKSNSKTIKAVVINHRNYMGNSPVSHKFSYSYQFEVNGKSYTGDTHDSQLDIGDTILVRYASDYPIFNETEDTARP